MMAFAAFIITGCYGGITMNVCCHSRVSRNEGGPKERQ